MQIYMRELQEKRSFSERGSEKENKYQVAAFLANANQESLSAFAYSMNPNYGINEIVCNNNVGRTDPGTGEFIQDPTPCSNAWGGEYGIYWGRGAMQVKHKYTITLCTLLVISISGNLSQRLRARRIGFLSCLLRSEYILQRLSRYQGLDTADD